MSEPNPLRDAFDDLRTTTLPRISPPGVDAVRRTLHRRRARRTATALVAAGVVAVGAIGALAHPWSKPPTPVGGPPPTPTASAWVSPTPSALTPSAVASSSRAVGPGQGGGPPQCAKDGVGIPATNGDGTFRMEFSPLKSSWKTPCAGVRVKVWLVYYQTGPDGTRSLVNSEISYLSAGKRSVPMSPQGGPCVTWLIGSGTGPIPDQLPATDEWLNQPGPADPFWDPAHAQSGVRQVSLSSDCPVTTPSPTPEAEPTPTP